ncbi:MAG TPA: hypothetical protein VFS14_04890, partial [Candidatus Saccharimonadales bacterium]|nr:hypothetical protein [Candidatus Saccharimonadales bacterium]
MNHRTSHRSNQEQPIYRRFVRGADGRLHLAEPGSQDIGDIWAEQKRIRLSEAVGADRRKAEKAKGRTAPKEIVLNIGVPKIRLPKIKRPKLVVTKKKVLFAGVAVAVCLVAAGGFLLLSPGGKQEDGKGVLAAGKSTPDFETLLPAS